MYSFAIVHGTIPEKDKLKAGRAWDRPAHFAIPLFFEIPRSNAFHLPLPLRKSS